jgi:hypothetical protein
MGIPRGGQQNLIQQQKGRGPQDTPRSVVYRNQPAREVAVEGHALDYATQRPDNFEAESL